MSFQEAALADWTRDAAPDDAVIAQGLKECRTYDACLILDQQPQGQVDVSIVYNPELTLPEQRETAEECKRRVDSFRERGLASQYHWQERSSDGGFQAWIRHVPLSEWSIWP